MCVCVCVVCADWPLGQHSLLSLSSCSSVLSTVDNTQTRACVCMCVCVCVSFYTTQGAHPAAMKAEMFRWPALDSHTHTHTDAATYMYRRSFDLELFKLHSLKLRKLPKCMRARNVLMVVNKDFGFNYFIYHSF